MKKILVTGVGGGVGQSILKALHSTEYSVVGVDSEELAAGLYAVPKAYKGLPASDPRFIDRLLDICAREECKLVFPGLDVELLPLAEHGSRFLSRGIIPVVSSPDVVQICDDKLATSAFLRARGFPAPESCLLSEVSAFEKPIVLKPRCGGARSRNTYVVRSSRELDIIRQLVDPENCVAQEYISGDEYTCGSVTVSEKCIGAIAIRRLLRDGDTYKAFVERNSRIESFVCAVVEALKPFGACNIQLRLFNGEPFVFEINARCSGTTAARALAGFNEPKMIADYLLNQIPPAYSIRATTILRYWQELVVADGRLEALREKGMIAGDGTTL